MIKNVFKQLCPSESICQRQVTFRCVITELPDELVRKSSVIVLLNLGVKLLHPANFDEKLGEVFVSFLLPYSLLNTVSELVVAVIFPQFVNDFKVFL